MKKLDQFIVDAQRAHERVAELELVDKRLRAKLAVAARILRQDAAVPTRPGSYDEGVAFGKERGARWIESILNGDFDDDRKGPTL